MFGKNPRVNSLATRKQLLIAESELNRAQMLQEWQEIKAETHALTVRASAIKSIISSAVSLVSGLSALTRNKAAADDTKPAWWQTVLKGAGIVSTFWSDFSAARGNQKNK